MKKLLKSAASILLAAISAFSLPFSTAAATKGNSPYTGQAYTHASRFDGYRIYNGIDVSTHNGNIDWKSVKASGVDYAIIRLGYTGYSRERFSTRYDTAFEYNISGARAAGLPVGVYWYSQAVNTSEARQEAQKLLAKLRSYSIDLPVFYDYEFAGVGDSGRLDYAWSSGAVNKAMLTANAEAFCNEIQSAGYDAGVYASKSFLENQIDGALLGRKYNIWLAHYNNSTPYAGSYYMWQYSSKGRVRGISGNVDCNFAYLPQGASLTDNRKVSGITTSARGDAGKLLKITWGAMSGATKYEIYDTTNGKNELKGTASTNEFTFTDLNPAWEYDIVVRAYCGRKTYNSLPHRICAAPAPVQNLELTATGHNSIKATWDYAVCHGYYIQWSTDKDFKTDLNGAFISGTYNTEYNISTADTANKYFVRIRSLKSFNGTNVYSDFGEAAQIESLVPPGEFAVTGRGDGGKALWLDWTDVDSAESYEIYDITNGANELKGTSETSDFTFTDLNPAWEYDIKIVAKNIFDSAESTCRICAATPVVQNFTATVTGENTLKAEWDYAVCHGYYIQWSTDPTFTDKSQTNGAWINSTFTTSFEISTDKPSGEYYVRIRSWKNYQGGKIFSDFCEGVSPSGLTEPRDFAVTGRGNGGTALWLDWADVKNAENYYIYDVTNGANTLKGITQSSKFTFVDLNPAWEYDIKVVAKNGENSSEATYRICAATAPVENFKASATGANTIKATWDYAVSHGYYIQWSTDPTFTDKSQTNGAWINSTFTTSFEISTDKPSGEYYVRIRSWKNYQGGKIFSDFCEGVSPSGLTEPRDFAVTGRGNGGTALWLDWADVKNAENYYIYDVTNGANTLKGITQSSKFTFVDLNPAWEYDIKVVAKNGENSSEATYRICAATAPVENFKASATGANTIKATWDYAVSHGYYIQWSTDPTFTDKSQTNGAWINSTFTTSFEISTDKPASEYYVRIRSWKYYQGSKIFSDFCEPTVALQSEALADI
ncbi:MAG: GH25 family lysozyme [Eubacterium sp.]